MVVDSCAGGAGCDLSACDREHPHFDAQRPARAGRAASGVVRDRESAGRSRARGGVHGHLRGRQHLPGGYGPGRVEEPQPVANSCAADRRRAVHAFSFRSHRRSRRSQPRVVGAGPRPSAARIRAAGRRASGARVRGGVLARRGLPHRASRRGADAGGELADATAGGENRHSAGSVAMRRRQRDGARRERTQGDRIHGRPHAGGARLRLPLRLQGTLGRSQRRYQDRAPTWSPSQRAPTC